MKLLWKKKKTNSVSVVDRGYYPTTTTTISSSSLVVTKQEDTISSTNMDDDHITSIISSSMNNNGIDVVVPASAIVMDDDDDTDVNHYDDEEDYVVVDSIVVPPTSTTTTNTITTPIKNTKDHNNNIIPSSPTSLGSGHYSPKDGKVQTFYRKSIIPTTPTPTPTKTTTTCTTTIPIHEEEIMKHPIMDVRSNDGKNDVNDRRITTSTTQPAHPQQQQEQPPPVVTTSIKNVTSTLTDDTSDTTEDDDDEEVVSVVVDIVKDCNNTNQNNDEMIESKTISTDSTRPINNDNDDPTTNNNNNTTTICTEETTTSTSSTTTTKTEQKPILFLRHSSSFLRVSDLVGMNTNINLSEHSTQSIPNYHCCSDTPPPGMNYDCMEQWVALDNGTGNSNTKDDDGSSTTATNTTTSTTSSLLKATTTIGTSPIGQIAIDALATTGFVRMFDESIWIPDAKTNKILSSKSINHWENCTFFPKQHEQAEQGEQHTTTYPIITDNSNTKLEDHILVWSGTFQHGLYGSDIPAIRSAAIIPMHPEQLLHLLIDSNRVKEYNSMSLGRTDLVTFDLPCYNNNNNNHTDTSIHTNHPNQILNNTRHIVTKVMRSESRPPLLRKTLQFTSILHARYLSNLDHDDGCIIVTRAVQSPSSTTNTSTTKNDDSSIIVSEILLGVNVILKIHSNDTSNTNNMNKCILLSVNHIRSPMVPLYIAKRLGVQAATNFIHDLRKCC
jgi:hypothetical protein